MDARLVLNPLVRFYLFDQYKDNEQWVCELARENGTFRYLVPKKVMECLSQFDGVRTTDDVVASFSSAVEIEHCKMDLIMFFVGHGVLIDGGAGAGEQPVFHGKRARYVQFRRRLLGGDLVARVSMRLGWLFRLPLVLGGLAVAFAVHVHVYTGPLVFPTTLTTLGPMSLLVVAFTSALGTFCHEFGHAAALVRHGGKKPEIGVGVYVIFPVMHTDVSEAWRLSRKKRSLRLPGRDGKIPEKVCRFGGHVPIRGSWCASRPAAAIRPVPGGSGTLGTCASNVSNETRCG